MIGADVLPQRAVQPHVLRQLGLPHSARVGRLILMFVLTVGVTLASPTPVADAKPASGMTVSITQLTPSTLGEDGRLRLTARVINAGTEDWTDVQAYLVIRRTPLTSGSELRSAVDTDAGFAGPRIVQEGRFAELGNVPAGRSKEFELAVAVKDLPISGQNGVYPVGVQLLGTDGSGRRGDEAIGRATTLLPHLDESASQADTTVVWPFILPRARLANRQIANVSSFIASISDQGQLRNLLDLARSSPARGSGYLVDPALIDAADDLAKRKSAGGRKLTEDEVTAVTQFRDHLVELAQQPSAWIFDYDRTDVLALSKNAGQRRRLYGAVERATETVIAEHDLSGARASWPTSYGVTSGLLRGLRERGAAPVIVSSRAVPRWSTPDGVLVKRRTDRGDIPLLVDDNLTRGIPGTGSVATLRQRVLASAALSALEGGRREAVIIVDPKFNPGVIGSTELSAEAPYVAPQTLSSLQARGRYDGSIAPARNRPISKNQVKAVDAASKVAASISNAALDSSELDDRQARELASGIGVRWRADTGAGVRNAREIERRFAGRVKSIQVEGPASVTFAGSSGTFPVTVSNKTSTAIRLKLRLDSSNPALKLPNATTVEVAAGERKTVNVEVDLGDQNTTTVTAHLESGDGRIFGSSSEFIVRSSRVGVTLWTLMGGVALLAAFALSRRFTRNRRTRAAADGTVISFDDLFDADGASDASSTSRRADD